MNRDILSGLADALMGIGPELMNQTGPDEDSFYICVSVGAGRVKKSKAKSLIQAERVVADYKLLGYNAWIQDKQGNPIIIAEEAPGMN